MGQSSDGKSAFDLSGDQISRLLCIGSDDDMHGTASGQEQSAHKKASSENKKPLDVFPQVKGYETIEKVAESGQGQVWRAVQLSTGRELAIKIPKVGSAASERARLRFEREIELVARLKHPNIARIYESGIDRGQHYYVMDFIDGINLDEYVRKNGLTPRQILELMQSICRAVQHAHQMGIMHRDLKPSNILVTNEGHPYVVDFGLAKELLRDDHSPLVSMDGETIGTPAYMSPEQARGQTNTIDTRTDVYSLGVILFGLLTGELPHDLSGSRQQVLRRIAEEEVRQPRDICPKIDRDIELLLLKSLDHDPERRYISVNDLSADIDNYLNGRALVAGPPSVSYRAKKFVGRHRALVSSVIIVTIIIIISLIASITMYIRAEIQAQRSQAIHSFLNDSVLSLLDPYRSQGGEVTAMSVLDSVAAALEGRFPDDPLIEASIQHRLGWSYARSDNHDAAVVHLKRALEIRRDKLGDDHPDTVDTIHILGWTYWNQGRANEAEPLLSESVGEYAQIYGPDNATTLQGRLMLANNYQYMGEYRKALGIAQDVLARAQRVKGDEHKQGILATAAIGGSHNAMGDYTKAEQWLSKAVDTAQRVLGEDHAWTAEFTGLLGPVYLRQCKFSDAETTLQDAYDKASRVFGDNSITHDVLMSQICAYVGLGQIERAVNLYDELKSSRIRWFKARGKWALNAKESVYPKGNMQYVEESNTYTIEGVGIGIWDTLDEFHFASKMLNGDGAVKVRMDNVRWITNWTQAGIMIRDNIEPTSKHISLLLMKGGVVDFQCRRKIRGPTESRRLCVRDMTFPYWIKLQRRGNRFTAFHSSDGSNFKEVRGDDPNRSVSMEVRMGEVVHVGLVVTSTDAVRAAKASFSNVDIIGNVNPNGPLTESKDVSLLATVSPTNKSR